MHDSLPIEENHQHYRHLKTSEIEVSLDAANFLPSTQMIVVSSLGIQPNKKVRHQVDFFKEVRITARELNQILTGITSVLLFCSQCVRYKSRANYPFSDLQ